MSRIGRKPIQIPSGVEVEVKESAVRVKGPKGELRQTFRPEMQIVIEDGVVRVERPGDTKTHRALHGLTRALLSNMVEGVTGGFRKTLEIVGVGYRAEKRGDVLVLHVGFSHLVEYPQPEGISITTPNATTVVVEGIDRQRVGQVAAEIRAYRPPEPYKGKGIQYQGEEVRRKAGKAGGK
jgi:large subunit ribosomal protein L6